MKRILSICLMLALMLALVPASRAADVTASGSCSDTVFWELADGVLTVSGQGVIPEYHSDWVWNQTQWEVLGDAPWTPYRKQITAIIVEDGITRIESGAFANLLHLKTFHSSDTVVEIGSDAFVNCNQLSEIMLGDHLDHIGDSAFYGAVASSIQLPASLKTVSASAFNGMGELKEIKVDANSRSYQSQDGVLFSKDGKTLLFYPPLHGSHYDIPDTTEIIGDSSFLVSKLKSVSIPDSVKTIQAYAFSDAELESVIVPGSVKVISMYAFLNCRELTTAVFQEGVEKLERDLFQGCDRLTDIYIPLSMIRAEPTGIQPETAVHFAVGSRLLVFDDGSMDCAVQVTLTGMERYREAFRVLDLVNQERVKVGTAPLKMDQRLLEAAMQRAFETAVYWSHTRPDGTDCFTVNPLSHGENIAFGGKDAETAMEGWMNSSAGHREQILNDALTTIGVGCVQIGNTYYWVQCFGNEQEDVIEATTRNDRESSREVRVLQNPEYYNPVFQIEKDLLRPGETTSLSALWGGAKQPFENITVEISNSEVVSVQGSAVTAKAVGKAELKLYYGTYREGAETISLEVREPGGNITDPTQETGFIDVDPGAYYAPAVAWAVENKITNGTAATTFSPNQNCTRGQMVTFLWRSAGSPEPDSTRNPFKDVKSGSYYYKAVLWAVEKGITNGTSQTTFSPDDTVTRGQTVTFLWRLKGEPTVKATNPFKDVKEGQYYTSAVLWAVKNGVTNGTSDTTFAPNNPCTRAQIVTFLYRTNSAS